MERLDFIVEPLSSQCAFEHWRLQSVRHFRIVNESFARLDRVVQRVRLRW